MKKFPTDETGFVQELNERLAGWPLDATRIAGIGIALRENLPISRDDCADVFAELMRLINQKQDDTLALR